MDPIFIWIETSGLSVWARESPSLFAFPGILALHAIGMAIVAGMSTAIALRILGIAPDVSLGEMKRFVPIIWFGFWVNLSSGIILFIAYPTKALTDPVFYFKITCVTVGILLFKRISRRVLDRSSIGFPLGARTERWLAIGSLVCWVGAIGGGRFLAYTYVKLMTI